jgi:hypothetical protein
MNLELIADVVILAGSPKRQTIVMVQDSEIEVCLSAVRSAWHELCCLRVTAKTTNLRQDSQDFARDAGRDGGNRAFTCGQDLIHTTKGLAKRAVDALTQTHHIDPSYATWRRMFITSNPGGNSSGMRSGNGHAIPTVCLRFVQATVSGTQ